MAMVSGLSTSTSVALFSAAVHMIESCFSSCCLAAGAGGFASVPAPAAAASAASARATDVELGTLKPVAPPPWVGGWVSGATGVEPGQLQYRVKFEPGRE
jgi:hypothetical protein